MDLDESVRRQRGGELGTARTLEPLMAAACTYRTAFGPRAGQKALTEQNAMPRDAGFEQALCDNMNGFSLHDTVRCGADERQALEQLCRYITHTVGLPKKLPTPACASAS